MLSPLNLYFAGLDYVWGFGTLSDRALLVAFFAIPMIVMAEMWMKNNDQA